MSKKNKLKNYYGDVQVTVKRRLRVDFTHESVPGSDDMLKILRSEKYNDITDSENLEFLSVDNIDVEEIVD